MPPITLPELPSDGRTALRPLGEEDVAAYVSAFHDDPDLGRLLGIETDPDETGLAERIARMGRQRDEGRYGELAITDAGGFAGSLTLHSLDWKNRRGELGFWIVPSARRRGLARAAVRLALRWTFRDLDLERVELTTTPENDAVARLAGRLGFTREGLLRGRNLERGRRVDVVVFGLLRDEWREGLSDRA